MRKITNISEDVASSSFKVNVAKLWYPNVSIESKAVKNLDQSRVQPTVMNSCLISVLDWLLYFL
jgi:hypothetical protein